VNLNQLKRRRRKKMNSGLINSTEYLYGFVSASVNAIEYKTENDNRAKQLNDAYWKSTAGYDAIFAEYTHSLTKSEIQTGLVSGSLTLSLNSAFDVVSNRNISLLPSIVNYVFPGDSAHSNENPAAVLTITEWLIHDIIRPLGGGFMNPWMYPTVAVSDVGTGVYTFTFTMDGALSDKARLEEAIRTKLSDLANRSVSYNAGTVAAVFATIVPNTDLALINPVTVVPTLWTKAISFPDASSDDKYMVDPVAGGPLTRSNTETVRPNASGKTSPASQPWAVTTVFKYTNEVTPLTLFAQSSTPLNSTFAAGIWLELLGNQLNLTVGQQGTAVYLRYTDVLATTLKKDSWIGLCLTWNGHQSDDDNPMTQDLRAAYQLTFIDLSTSQISKPPWTEIQFTNNGGVHAFGPTTSHYIGAGHIYDASATDDHNGFRGLIASHVATTLLPDTLLPSDAEVALMVRNPTQWLQSYKAGEAWRAPSAVATAGTAFDASNADPSFGGVGTKIWLMGDYTSDTYQAIYNQACLSQTMVAHNFTVGDLALEPTLTAAFEAAEEDAFTDLVVVPTDWVTAWAAEANRPTIPQMAAFTANTVGVVEIVDQNGLVLMSSVVLGTPGSAIPVGQSTTVIESADSYYGMRVYISFGTWPSLVPIAEIIEGGNNVPNNTISVYDQTGSTYTDSVFTVGIGLSYTIRTNLPMAATS
jgi:hypothetical protein